MQVQHLVRASDPLSSVMAAERSAAFSGAHCARILAALKLYGPSTAAELQAYTGLTIVQSDRRLPDLSKAGQARVVQDNGNDLIRKGYRVWEAV
ncbi:winged helix DNA-binding domain-containing protein [Acidovorax radicis]|uniref:winged helix DNA-binding domain-containing protein n=1 Tax=Acidovorax radicis TaxID=758826 RepID=UPI001CFB5337|nr:winged helix DNA-binding domain-containing protein [Acidovorax radicis]UCV00272.1 hypothetical protein KI609_05660 [Acidovorax radicis]